MEKISFKNKLPQNFEKEEKALISNGILTWIDLMNLKDEKINYITSSTFTSVRNFKRLRCIAMFLHCLKIPLNEAALLMHSGIPSIKSLSNTTPNHLIKMTGRFERTLYNPKKATFDLKRASILIKLAKQYCDN